MPKPRFIIYCHTNRMNGKKYVGQTKYSLEHRWSGHVHAALKRGGRTAFCNAIRKHGADAFTHEVIDVVTTQAGANSAERAWIEHLSCQSPNGYNLSSGGETSITHEMTRQKISESWRDPVKKASRLSKIREAWANPELRMRLSEATTRRMAAMTAEERVALNKKISARVREGLPPIDDEWRRVRGEGSKASWAKRTPEERARIVAPMLAMQTTEVRRRTVRTMIDGNAQRSPEERRALALKAWETKRARYGGTPGLYPRRCRACGKWGHYATACPSKKEDKQ